MAAPGDDEVLVQFNIMGGDASIGARASDGSAREESNIFDVPSTDAWKDIWKSLKSNTTVLAVLDFTAQWCGPCRFIEPAVKELAGKFASVKFYKIDVDKMEDVATKWKVRAMPTFILVKGGQEVSRVVGAKKNELDRKITQALQATKN
ncbi:thioredoxin H2-2-like [Ananas comosus]|uniref:Thioredoxin H2-2 n=1 Tax=Ananas comosus TaxID=4615 RepID=A0A199UN84_ANACO|nr:thioredoxin H2-2-like [Ananas comosus]OAY66302.1 Thioredoxin H2-2 [Ananas comosus]